VRRAAKVDANQAAVVKALRRVGCSVQSLAAVGAGVPDLLVGRNGRTFLLEVKDGSKVKSAQKLTPAQVDWHSTWKGAPVVVVSSVVEALREVEFHAEVRP
jgi:Holliday junction resolvase